MAPRNPDFRTLLGEAGWSRLPAAVRDRFDSNNPQHANATYSGTMKVVRASTLGTLVAWLMCALGAPLVPGSGDNVATIVKVMETPETNGIVWERHYHFDNGRTATLKSTKRLNDTGHLVEDIAGRVEMDLAVFEHQGSLVFESRLYRLRLGPLFFTMPVWLLPGKTTVIHTDLGNGLFRFLMRTVHPIIGEVFLQDGTFRLEETP